MDVIKELISREQVSRRKAQAYQRAAERTVNENDRKEYKNLSQHYKKQADEYMDKLKELESMGQSSSK